MAGLDATGLTIPTLVEILEEIGTQQREDIADDLDTSAESVIGRLNAVVAEKHRELWELAQAVYNARVPGGATGATLDGQCGLTGTTRDPASTGRVVLTLTVAAGQTIPAGAIAHVLGQPTNRWVTLDDAVNASGVTADVDVDAEAAATGVYVANAGTITVIATPVTGWTAVTNALDASEGSEIEGDPALRVRRVQELSRAGTSPVDAIRADLLAMAYDDGSKVLLGASVEENASAFTDSYGRAPHTVEAIVQLPAGLSVDALAIARQRVADQLWASKAGGIDTHGEEEGSVTDALGIARTLRWTEPTEVDVYVAVTPRVGVGYESDAALKTAIVEWSEALRLGADVQWDDVHCAIKDFAGVTNVRPSWLTIGTSLAEMRDADIAIGPRQLAVFDTSRITVVSS